jgi:hypothetical protein
MAGRDTTIRNHKLVKIRRCRLKNRKRAETRRSYRRTDAYTPKGT